MCVCVCERDSRRMYLRPSVRTNFSTSRRESASLLREGRRTTGREGEGGEEQQGPSSENADGLTGLLRAAETNKRRREESGEGRRRNAHESTQTACVHMRKVPILHLAAVLRHPVARRRRTWTSALSPGTVGRAKEEAQKERERDRDRLVRKWGEKAAGVHIKRCFMGSCGLAPVPVQRHQVVPSGSRLTVSMSRHCRTD